MIVRKRVWEESYGGRKFLNFKVKDLGFYYLIRNNDNQIIMKTNRLGFVNKRDYHVVKLYENEFTHLKNKAIQNMCNIIFNLKKEYDDIFNKFKDILLKEVSVTIEKSDCARFNRYYNEINYNHNFTQKITIIEMILKNLFHMNSFSEFQKPNVRDNLHTKMTVISDDSINMKKLALNQEIFRLNDLYYKIKAYKEILEEIHNITYDDIMK